MCVCVDIERKKERGRERGHGFFVKTKSASSLHENTTAEHACRLATRVHTYAAILL